MLSIDSHTCIMQPNLHYDIYSLVGQAKQLCMYKQVPGPKRGFLREQILSH